MGEGFPSARIKSWASGFRVISRFIRSAYCTSINWELAPESINREAESESLTITGRVKGSSDPKSVSNKGEEAEEPKIARREIFSADLKAD
jgi:hypothetical protein